MSKMTIESGIYYISIVSSINEVYNDINEMMKNYRVILGIALVVTCILAYVFSKKITRPIEKLSDAVSQMAKGQYDTRAKIKSDGEVGDLVIALILWQTGWRRILKSWKIQQDDRKILRQLSLTN